MAWFIPATLATGNSVTAAIWNNNFSNMADTGWLTVSSLGYINSWSNGGRGPATASTVPGYRLTGNIVRLGGDITGGVSGNGAFTLPVGYRPIWQIQSAIAMESLGGSLGVIQVAPTGLITPYYAAQTVPSLDNVSFPID